MSNAQEPRKKATGKGSAPAAGSGRPSRPSQSRAQNAPAARSASAGNAPKSGASQNPPRNGKPAPRRTTPRRVRLTLSRVDTWSVLKIAFLLSVAVAIASVVLVATLWTVLAGMGAFNSMNTMLRTLDRQGSQFDVLDYIGFGRTVSFSIVIGVLNVVLMTAIATLTAFLYNICASLVGGVQLTLSDE